MNQVSPDIIEYIQDMPKAEIHIHLEGAIQPETVIKLAERHDCLDILPGSKVETLQNWFTFTDFPHFIDVFLTILRLLRTAEDFALIAYENGADMAAQNIRYRELTITPNMHTNQHGKKLSIEDVLQGLEAGRQRAFQEFGVEMRWVFDCSRTLSFPDRKRGTYDPGPAQRTLEYAIAGMDRGVIGLGLGGYEVGAPPEPFAKVFAAAKKAGLLSLPHAGETVGPKSVWGALNALQADRIGHGVRAIEDPDLLLAIKERQIPLEISPTSNQRLHVFEEMSEHPLPAFDKMGILVTVNSDDPPLFNTTLCKEYEILAREFGYDKKNIARIARNAFYVCGAEPKLKARLLAEFDEWVSSQNSAG
jgi:aminodeoxyfutalosine deaminase